MDCDCVCAKDGLRKDCYIFHCTRSQHPGQLPGYIPTMSSFRESYHVIKRSGQMTNALHSWTIKSLHHEMKYISCNGKINKDYEQHFFYYIF